jgi:hypothetical protein
MKERDMQKLETALIEAEQHRQTTMRAHAAANAAVMIARLRLAEAGLANCKLWHVIHDLRHALEELDSWQRANPTGAPWFTSSASVQEHLLQALERIATAGEQRAHLAEAQE